MRNRLAQELWLVRAVDADDARRPVADAGVGGRLQRERPEERVGGDERGLDVEVVAERGRRPGGADRDGACEEQPCRRESGGPRGGARRAGRRSCSPPDAPPPRPREPSRGRRSVGPAGSAGTRGPRPGRGGMPERARSGTGGRAGTAASGARSERRAPAPSGRRPPASARRPPGTPSWARVGRRPPRQQTRTPSRARPLRRMRGADRPPRHDSFGRAAALPGGRWGKEPVGRRRRRHVPAAAHYSVSTRVDPRSARNLRARARIPRSRHRSSLDDRAASRRPTRRILGRRVLGRRR